MQYQLGIGSYRVAWMMTHKPRRAMLDPGRSELAGDVEVDETALTQRTKQEPTAGGRGRSHRGKMQVAGGIEVIDGRPGLGAYKSLGQVEQAFRSLKTVDLECAFRPLFHWAAPRVRAHVFRCMLAYYVEAHMRQRLAAILFDDHNPEGADIERASVVAPAERSEAATHKAATRRSDDGLLARAQLPDPA